MVEAQRPGAKLRRELVEAHRAELEAIPDFPWAIITADAMLEPLLTLLDQAEQLLPDPASAAGPVFTATWDAESFQALLSTGDLAEAAEQLVAAAGGMLRSLEEQLGGGGDA